MDDRTRWLLLKLVEECNEVIHAALKAREHGLDNHHPERPDSSNRRDLERELGDVRAVEQLLDIHCGFDIAGFVWNHAIDKRQVFIRLLRERGLL